MPSEQDIASILHTLLGKQRLASLADENGVSIQRSLPFNGKWTPGEHF